MILFEKIIDQTLLNQMKDLIIRMTDKEIPEKTLWNCLFEEEKAKGCIQEQYNLKYPGEVLERYEEHCGGGRNQTIALALALAETKPLLRPTMFVGTQYNDFIRKVRQQAKGDFYLNCILYLLTEKENEEGQLFDGILYHDYTSMEEMTFAVYILQNRPEAWDLMKKYGSRFLGKERNYKAYGNLQFYVWILKQFEDNIRKCRTKDINILKALLELPCKYVKEATTTWNRLQEAGYSAQEILYLNLLLPEELRVSNVLMKNSITMERMALAGVKELLNSEVIEDICLFELCKKFIKEYHKYYICLEGKRGIVDSLYGCVQIKNKELFYFLYEWRKKEDLPESWFYADFGQQEWCSSVNTWMEEDEFTKLFSNSMIYHDDRNLDIWLKNYQKCTGKDYGDVFWTLSCEVHLVFRLFVSEKRIHLEELLNRYVADEKSLPKEELDEKWAIMKKNISLEVCSLRTHEGYIFWDTFDRLYGISRLDEFLSYKNTVLKAVNLCIYNNYFQNMDLKEDILTVDEQAKLFDWVEQEVYRKLPEHYEEFLYKFLMRTTTKNNYPEESMELFYMIKDSVSQSERYSLCQKYYTEKEWKEFMENEERKIAKQKQEEKNQELKAYMDKIRKDIQESDQSGEVFDKIVSSFPRYEYGSWKEEKAVICLKLLDEYMKPKGYMKKKTIAKLAELLFHRFEYGKMELGEVLGILGRTEVICDESTED